MPCTLDTHDEAVRMQGKQKKMNQMPIGTGAEAFHARNLEFCKVSNLKSGIELWEQRCNEANIPIALQPF